MDIYNNKQLYICEAAYMCHKPGNCSHREPHRPLMFCSKAKCNPTNGSINDRYQVECIPIPNDFIDEGEFKL